MAKVICLGFNDLRLSDDRSTLTFQVAAKVVGSGADFGGNFTFDSAADPSAIEMATAMKNAAVNFAAGFGVPVGRTDVIFIDLLRDLI